MLGSDEIEQAARDFLPDQGVAFLLGQDGAADGSTLLCLKLSEGEPILPWGG
jgi:hypothetical protein